MIGSNVLHAGMTSRDPYPFSWAVTLRNFVGFGDVASSTWAFIGRINVARFLSFDVAAAQCSFSHLSKAPRYKCAHTHTMIVTNYPALRR